MFLSTSCFSYQKTVSFVWTSLLCNLAFQCHKDLCPISKGSLSISQEGHLVMLEKSKYACLPVLWIGIKINWSCCPHPKGAKNTTKKAKKQNKTRPKPRELMWVNYGWSIASEAQPCMCYISVWKEPSEGALSIPSIWESGACIVYLVNRSEFWVYLSGSVNIKAKNALLGMGHISNAWVDRVQFSGWSV